ncbi:hypothetical protein QFZ81_001026 [Paenibacillus sp. V4I9]|uniref:hypothetical protein n=1 Tax=Paenibacillus sp. V4I9 TaxID=3042308 RepID=UPI0027882862|nr:hypothetical protein [Paenibacillus sp. V4I9]MDQ0885938.1 hypothetical protein [Paenibacillus sp. V4I9]
MIHWNLVEKRVGSESMDRIKFEVDKLKLSFCDEIIDFGLKNDFNDVTLINVFKESLGTHIKSVEDTLQECENITVQLMRIFPNIPMDEASINNRNIKILHTNDDVLEILFSNVFDKFLSMNIYGYIQLTKSKTKLYLKKTEVLWSKNDSLLFFDYASHFASLTAQVDTLKSIEEINNYRSQIKQELFRCFRVTDYQKLYDYHEKDDYDMIRLGRSIGISYRACDVKVKLINHGISADNPRLVELIVEREKYNSLVEDRDEMIDLLGEDKYENSIEVSLQKIERLMNEVKINLDELDKIMI